MEEKQQEYLLVKNENRFNLFPIKHPDIWEFAEFAEASVWFPKDIDFSKDKGQFKKLTKDEQHYIKSILAFFAGSDGPVNENIDMNFSHEVQIPEARSFYYTQIFVENIHSKTYSLLIETYVEDNDEKLKLYNAINTNPAVKAKIDWACKWASSNASFATRLIANAIVEGVFFSGAFCSIYWIRTKGILEGLTQSNDYIAKDEGLHCLFAVLLYTKYVVNKVPEDVVHTIFREAVDIEKNFINDALPCKLIGMNADLMSQYIEFCADRLIDQLGYKKIFGSTNPFGFMDNIGIDKITNFFEKRATEYSHPQFTRKTEIQPTDDF